MRYIIFFLFILSSSIYADTIDHYMNIANNIPQQEIKADPQAQAWARSARTILSITSESIAETLILTNESVKELGKAPLFCLPVGIQLNEAILNSLIQKTYNEMPGQSEKNKMTISQIALIGIRKQYPCQQQPIATQQITHVSALEELKG